MKRIVFLITNDPNYDQRMQRICHSLQTNGYKVTLIGTDLRGGKNVPRSYEQKQLHSVFRKGKMFYAEFNLKAFFTLLFMRFDAVCAIDLDAIMPCYLVSKLRNKKRVYDAHELFCELPEVIRRPRIYKAWKRIEKWCLPAFRHGYTVSESISAEYKKMYGHSYSTIRNISLLQNEKCGESPIKHPYILYQGALNEGRGIEQLLIAMKHVPIPLVICGEGNFSERARALVDQSGLQEKVLFRGMIAPSLLPAYTCHATIGLNQGEGTGLNNYLSLNNKFFDYIHAGLPQIGMDFPEFRKMNNEFDVALLIPDLQETTIANAINTLLTDTKMHARLKQNCERAKLVLNWQREEKKLLDFYKRLFTAL